MNGLEGEDLDAVRALADRRMDGQDGDRDAVELGGRRQLGARATGHRAGAGVQRAARGEQDAERAAVGVGARERAAHRQVVERVELVGQARVAQVLAPARRGAPRDLLQRDEVGRERRDRGRLLVEAGDAAGDVPGDEPAQGPRGSAGAAGLSSPAG